MVYQHDVFKLQVCVYDLSAVANLQKYIRVRSVICDDILVTASRRGGAHTCCTIGLISFSGRGWKFLFFNRWYFYHLLRLLSSCSNSRHKCPLSSKALYHRTILHLSGSSFFILCRLDICGHRCQIDNYQMIFQMILLNDFPLLQPGITVLTSTNFDQQNFFVAYLKKCLHQMRTFDQFDRHSRRVIHPRALCNYSKAAIPQEGFHQIKVGFRNKKVSWTYLVLMSRIVHHCGIHRLGLSLARLDVDIALSHHIACSL